MKSDAHISVNPDRLLVMIHIEPTPLRLLLAFLTITGHENMFLVAALVAMTLTDNASCAKATTSEMMRKTELRSIA